MLALTASVLSNQIIAEAANGPITMAADEYLRKEKNVLIIPVSKQSYKID